MEKVKITSLRGWAKMLGAVICITGSLVFTFWKGGYLFQSIESRPLININSTKGSAGEYRHGKENWIKGSALILTSNIAGSASLILQGVVIAALVYYLQTWCISHNGPVFAAMFTPLQVVFVGIFSAIAFAERIHLGSMIGTGLIVLGLYCVLWGKRQDENAAKQPDEGKGIGDNRTLEISMDDYALANPDPSERK
ncbi:unnamed protein product [Dovyalis caffra]|uniref:WAT1-related protein n=1 Tax=Dovyalis caffra TaxID=77055 RepID=A0AAV1SWR3_9ROSI|nr:unnamed protein product [Dovyalis caffra]